MSDPAPEVPKKPQPEPSGDKGDFIALGIGCVVVLIFVAALVIVAMSRE